MSRDKIGESLRAEDEMEVASQSRAKRLAVSWPQSMEDEQSLRLSQKVALERRQRDLGERKLRDATRELEDCRLQMLTLGKQFSRMQEMARILLLSGSRREDDDPSEPSTLAKDDGTRRGTRGVVGSAGSAASEVPDDGPLLDTSPSAVRSLTQRLHYLEAQNCALALENSAQREHYSCCLDEVSKQVMQAVLTQQATREQCSALKARLMNVERQNRALATILLETLGIPACRGGLQCHRQPRLAFDQSGALFPGRKRGRHFYSAGSRPHEGHRPASPLPSVDSSPSRPATFPSSLTVTRGEDTLAHGRQSFGGSTPSSDTDASVSDGEDTFRDVGAFHGDEFSHRGDASHGEGIKLTWAEQRSRLRDSCNPSPASSNLHLGSRERAQFLLEKWSWTRGLRSTKTECSPRDPAALPPNNKPCTAVSRYSDNKGSSEMAYSVRCASSEFRECPGDAPADEMQVVVEEEEVVRSSSAARPINVNSRFLKSHKKKSDKLDGAVHDIASCEPQRIRINTHESLQAVSGKLSARDIECVNESNELHCGLPVSSQSLTSSAYGPRDFSLRPARPEAGRRKTAAAAHAKPRSVDAISIAGKITAPQLDAGDAPCAPRASTEIHSVSLAEASDGDSVHRDGQRADRGRGLSKVDKPQLRPALGTQIATARSQSFSKQPTKSSSLGPRIRTRIITGTARRAELYGGGVSLADASHFAAAGARGENFHSMSKVDVISNRMTLEHRPQSEPCLLRESVKCFQRPSPNNVGASQALAPSHYAARWDANVAVKECESVNDLVSARVGESKLTVEKGQREESDGTASIKQKLARLSYIFSRKSSETNSDIRFQSNGGTRRPKTELMSPKSTIEPQHRTTNAPRSSEALVPNSPECAPSPADGKYKGGDSLEKVRGHPGCFISSPLTELVPSFVPLPSIEEKVMQEIQANVLRQSEKQMLVSAGSKTSLVKPFFIASLLGLRRSRPSCGRAAAPPVGKATAPERAGRDPAMPPPPLPPQDQENEERAGDRAKPSKWIEMRGRRAAATGTGVAPDAGQRPGANGSWGTNGGPGDASDVQGVGTNTPTRDVRAACLLSDSAEDAGNGHARSRSPSHNALLLKNTRMPSADRLRTAGDEDAIGDGVSPASRGESSSPRGDGQRFTDFARETHTLDSGIGTFPPVDPATRSSGRTSLWRVLSLTSQNDPKKSQKPSESPHNCPQQKSKIPPGAPRGPLARKLPHAEPHGASHGEPGPGRPWRAKPRWAPRGHTGAALRGSEAEAGDSARKSDAWENEKRPPLREAGGALPEGSHGAAAPVPRLAISGHSLQIQCYQCEELRLNDDCSAPENVANCTVNVQDACQKEVLVREQGTFYRKSCASSAACLIASAGYQSFCLPGRVRSVCISCCNTPLCNGPRSLKRRVVFGSAGATRQARPALALLAGACLFLSALRSALLWTDVPSRPAYASRTP
ncbi:uncharacterized protein LOC133357308 isoform X2 [Lethenteron reissneri]|uniref:uncharacterized protein LOC133357308 isoform X2 n=1 Tax=Lethenteron reissneri TaxID=7753 RepID=UPI002AB74827|nr:uncharacterized protein LOC133357308 isoform X2 [Lethenteron reissneri]